MTQSLDQLKHTIGRIQPEDRVAILTHNNPDPDAIAAAFGLARVIRQTQGANSQILYGGIVGRANNRAMVRHLEIPIQHITLHSQLDFDHYCLVDTQPGMQNNMLPDSIVPLLVVDHHPLPDEGAAPDYFDHRLELGSTSTIITQYLTSHDVEIDSRLATALFYGIKTDTEGLARDSGELDREMFFFLYPKIDPELLNRIENPDLSIEYYRDIGDAVLSCRVCDHVLIADLDDSSTPDMPAEMADFLLRMNGVEVAFVYGLYQGIVHFSLRTSLPALRLGRLALVLVNEIGTAGGHNRAAGGQIPYTPDNVRIMLERFYHFFAMEPGQFSMIYE